MTGSLTKGIRDRVSGHFLAGRAGSIFLLVREPVTPTEKWVLVVPPFAEEMNKSRRLVTEAAMALAQTGVATIVPDLYGTGDSAGDFADATWHGWLADLEVAGKWLTDNGILLSGICAIRAGAALAVAAEESGLLPPVRRTVLCQPVFDGGRLLRQFLRLRVAVTMMTGQPKETVENLRKRLVSGETLETAGYRLSPQLAADLEALASPEHLPKRFGAVHWLEIVRDLGTPLPVPTMTLIERTHAAGGLVEATSLVGEPFWTSTEVVVIPGLVEAIRSSFCFQDELTAEYT